MTFIPSSFPPEPIKNRENRIALGCAIAVGTVVFIAVLLVLFGK